MSFYSCGGGGAFKSSVVCVKAVLDWLDLWIYPSFHLATDLLSIGQLEIVSTRSRFRKTSSGDSGGLLLLLCGFCGYPGAPGGVSPDGE